MKTTRTTTGTTTERQLKQREYSAKRREKAKAKDAKVCTRCIKRKAADGQTECAECLTSRNERNQATKVRASQRMPWMGL